MNYTSRFGFLVAATFLSACDAPLVPDYESWKTANPYGDLKPTAQAPDNIPLSTESLAPTTSSAPSDVNILPAPMPLPVPSNSSFQPVPAAASTTVSPDKLTVDFGFFPSGTTCAAYGTSGKVSVQYGKEIEFTVRGNSTQLSFTCQQPDGKNFSVNVGALLPQNSTRLVAIQINQDNNAYMFWDQGGLMRRHVPGILRWH